MDEYALFLAKLHAWVVGGGYGLYERDEGVPITQLLTISPVSFTGHGGALFRDRVVS